MFNPNIILFFVCFGVFFFHFNHKTFFGIFLFSKKWQLCSATITTLLRFQFHTVFCLLLCPLRLQPHRVPQLVPLAPTTIGPAGTRLTAWTTPNSVRSASGDTRGDTQDVFSKAQSTHQQSLHCPQGRLLQVSLLVQPSEPFFQT